MAKKLAIRLKFVLVVWLVLIAANVWAQATVGTDLAFKSQYIWRGIPLNAESVLWPDVWASYQGFTGTVFGSLEMTDYMCNRGRCTELDFYADYTRTLGPIEASLGYGHFTYPHTGAAQTGELYAGVSADLRLAQVAVTGYLDVMDVKGFYLSPEISRTLESLPLQPSFTVSLGYGNARNNLYWFGVEKTGITDLTTGLSLTHSLPGSWGRYMTLTGDVNFSRLLDDELAAAYPKEREYLWFGLGLAISYPASGEQ